MEKKIWQHVLQYTFAAILAFGLFGVSYLLINNPVPESSRDALLILLGVLASAFTQVVSYFFGSSKGSSDKNEIISNGQR
jgi:hypothetical protein